MSAPGLINIPPGGAVGPAKLISTGTDDFGKIIITVASAKSYSLYTAKGESDLSQFELPPLPPQGLFDIRYSSQRYADDISSGQGIEMQGVQYPIKITAEATGIILSDESGKEIVRLKSGEEVTLSTPVSKLMVSENVIPSVYALEQNYPNPFNPGTTIQNS